MTTPVLSFRLSNEFIAPYAKKTPDWGFPIGGGNTLGELTFVSKYSRIKDNGKKEQWFETCRRCVEGYYSILKDHCLSNKTAWNESKAQHSAQDAYDRMFKFKWTPPGRGLANMGTNIVHDDNNIATLINCAAISTERISSHSVYEATMPFTRLMEMSMHGIGCGFDVRGAGKLAICIPVGAEEEFVVPDSREGWSESVGKILESYFFKNRPPVRFNYDLVRPEGAPLVRFGGKASGPGPLKRLHESIQRQFEGRGGEKVSSRDIVDLMNKIGKAVVAGGARRSALISLGAPSDTDYVNLKNWDLPENKERTGPDGWSWSSNNSVYADSDSDLAHLTEAISVNGEPGIIWLDVVNNYGRLADAPDMRDKANLTNPCGEIPLEGGGELCCLAELYPSRHDSLADFLRSVKHAYMYAKSVVLLSSPWAETNEIITRNRRIGVSMTGIVDMIESRGWNMVRDWMDKGYEYLRAADVQYSAWLGVRESLRLSTIKPAGSTSLLAGTTAGVHWPTTSNYFLRRQRFLKFDPVVEILQDAGYSIEPDKMDPNMTVVVEMPTVGLNIRSEREVSAWEKINLAANAQRFWSDNMVSVTVSFDKETEAKEIAPMLRFMQGQLKSVSFLPIDKEGTFYEQAPYEPLSEMEALRMLSEVRSLDRAALYSMDADAEGEAFCNSDVCEIPQRGTDAS